MLIISVVRQERSFVVGPGLYLAVEQVVGICSDGTVYTEAFRSRNATSNAHIFFPSELLIVSWTALIGKMLVGQI